MDMKKTIVWLIVCILIVILMGWSVLSLLERLPKSGLLRINGVDVTRENVIIRSNCAELPLTEVMKSLDVKVDWYGDGVAKITCKNKEYTLNLSDVSLVAVEGHSNLLLPPPGGKRFCAVLEKEVILDSNTIKSVMYQMGISISININVEDGIVDIESTVDGSMG